MWVVIGGFWVENLEGWFWWALMKWGEKCRGGMGGSSCPNWARPIIADSHAEFTLKLGSCLMCKSGKKS